MAIGSSALVMGSLLYAISLRIVVLSVVTLAQHSLSPLSTFPACPDCYIFVCVFLMYSLAILATHKPGFF